MLLRVFPLFNTGQSVLTKFEFAFSAGPPPSDESIAGTALLRNFAIQLHGLVLTVRTKCGPAPGQATS